jgi:hypothetical protein
MVKHLGMRSCWRYTACIFRLLDDAPSTGLIWLLASERVCLSIGDIVFTPTELTLVAHVAGRGKARDFAAWTGKVARAITVCLDE